VLQDPPFEFDQGRSGLEAVLDQLSPPRVEDHEGVGLPPGTVERFHQQLACTFTLRVLRDQWFEISDCVVGAPLGQRVRGAYLSGVES
jgi:hypothetical protein